MHIQYVSIYTQMYIYIPLQILLTIISNHLKLILYYSLVKPISRTFIVN